MAADNVWPRTLFRKSRSSSPSHHTMTEMKMRWGKKRCYPPIRHSPFSGGGIFIENDANRFVRQKYCKDFSGRYSG